MQQPNRVAELTPDGIRRAKEYLAMLRDGQHPNFPDDLLTEPRYVRTVTPAVYVEQRPFANRREAGEYLSQKLAPLRQDRIADNAGLWSWLGMFFFEQVTTRDRHGLLRISDSDVAYIIDPSGGGRGAQQRHRNRLLAAWEIYTRHGETAWPMLEQPVSSMEQIAEYLMNKIEVFRSAGVVDLAIRLYGDPVKRAYKQGFVGGGGRQRPPGGLRRLLDVLDQLNMTYDVYGMAAEQLMGLLPPEFDRWHT